MHLVIGGARSGKSNYAQQLASKYNDVVYIATATRVDDAMSLRIAHHIESRPTNWTTIEEPLQLAEQLQKLHHFDGVIVVDCLTLWLNNQLYHYPRQDFTLLFEKLVAAAKLCHQLILVTNEVGLGVIPMGEISQRFVDESGRMNQALASAADEVSMLVAGLVNKLKG